MRFPHVTNRIVILHTVCRTLKENNWNRHRRLRRHCRRRRRFAPPFARAGNDQIKAHRAQLRSLRKKQGNEVHFGLKGLIVKRKNGGMRGSSDHRPDSDTNMGIGEEGMNDVECSTVRGKAT